MHDASCERKTADNLKIHLEKAIDTVRVDYSAYVVGVVTDASGECRKARRLLALEHPDIVFLDCYAHQVLFSHEFTCLRADHLMAQVNLVVGDYFKSEAEALSFADKASDLITWLRSKTLLLALLREVQAAVPGNKSNIKAVIRAVLTRWTMHYQSYRRLRELHTFMIVVITIDEERPIQERRVITGDTRAKAKATEMVRLIKNPGFWHALAVYVIIEFFHNWMPNHCCAGWSDISNRSLLRRTLPRLHTAAWTQSS